MKNNITTFNHKDKIDLLVDNQYIGALYYRKTPHQLFWTIEDRNHNIENILTTMMKATEYIFKKAFPNTYKDYSWYYENRVDEE